jgi:riboflavin synthase
MFTGIVEGLATVQRVQDEGAGRTLHLALAFAHEVHLGESIAINGVCLTVVHQHEQSCRFQAGPETLSRTNLGDLRQGDQVNIERALKLSDRLGGHFVQGHVDGTGFIDTRQLQGDWETIWFRCAEELTSQMVPKGSIAVDGVSLTLVDVQKSRFSVALIPHTLSCTTLGFKQVGAKVNLETDLIGKYVARLTKSKPEAPAKE